MKRVPSQSVFLDGTYFPHCKFNQVEFIYKHCPIQPSEMKGLLFNGRCIFYCKDRTQCSYLAILQGFRPCFALCIEPRGHTDLSQTL